jgi:poly-gamma-glutamate synthesis protein (capsule biosynthesis protein)
MAGDGRNRQEPRRTGLDETVHYALKRHHRLRLFLAALALAIMILPSCQARINSPREPNAPGTGEATPASSVTLALLGDVMLGRDAHPTPETFAYLKSFLTSADLALANLESPLTDSPAQTSSPYVICAQPENVRYLVNAGFDLLSLANNHRLDCGREGLIETQKTLTDAGLGFIGPDSEPVCRSIHGMQLAFLAFDATNRFDLDAAVRVVRSARATGAIVIVSIHWGAEYQAGASSDQKQIAGQLADAGAALIWGHHPHVLQPSVWLRDHKTLVFYSLGNALFDQYGLEATRRSALVLVTLDRAGVEKVKIIPFLIDIQNSRITKAGQTDAELIMQYFK